MKISGGVCSVRAWNFARVEELWKELDPRTPYGKDYFHARLVYTDKDALREIQDDVDCFEHYLSGRKSPPGPDRLGWHLSRIPRLPFTASTDAESLRPGLVDLFLLKKFIANYRACSSLLDERTREHFGFVFSSEKLWDALKLGGSDEESFHFSDRYDPGLAEVRERISELSGRMEAERQRAFSAIEARWGIGFAGRDFVTIPMERGLEIAASSLGCADRDEPRLSVETCDDRSCTVRLLASPAMLELEGAREAARARERELESDIARGLGELAADELPALERYRKAVLRLDLARARFALAARYGMVRPSLGGIDDGLSVRKGAYLPLAKDCAAGGTEYFPLDFSLRTRAAVIFGSNMGGKTVVLRSLLFFQILAQCGLRVPAESYNAPVFDFLEYVGDEDEKYRGGLSSFGRELEALGKVIGRSGSGRGMVCFDEFAHTTSSNEADALLGAAISWFAHRAGGMAFFATHFKGAERDTGAALFRMGGLDLAEAERLLAARDGEVGQSRDRGLGEDGENRGEDATRGCVAEGSPDAGADSAREAFGLSRLRLVARAMRYVVIGEECRARGAGGSDALEVARLLGLDAEILEDARARLEGKGRTDGR